jgi:CYTH domain-containing protein/thymidylate kinase
MDIPLIAVTGGPCGGKTSFLSQAHQLLQEYGLYAVTLSETATELINAGLSPAMLGVEEFQTQVLTYSLNREEQYKRAIRSSPHAGKAVILCDRGILDCAAYVDKAIFARILKNHGHSIDEICNRYQMVVHLMSAADGAEEFYTLANNAARSESPEQARALDARTQRAWLNHPHHVIIDNSTTFEAKMRRALRSLARTLHMPEPLEIERKFHILNFNPDLMIPPEAVSIDITQDYLVTEHHGNRRVRRRNCNGGISFFYTEKFPTGNSGECIEREREISKDEYQQLLTEKDPTRETILKTRHCFPYDGKRFELDVFQGRHLGLVMLEVELQDITEHVSIPGSWKFVEVTDDPAFKNWTLAAE